MEGYLNQNQIDYVLYHLSMVFEIGEELKNRTIFQIERKRVKGKIIFPLSKRKLEEDAIIHLNEVPVLFPLSESEKIFEIDADGNLEFQHDLLKSAFFLLSGFQEFGETTKDVKGRFPYEISIQKRLGIVRKPVVNYYFESIIEGFKAFCEYHNLSYKEKRLFGNFGFFLTHDIDWVDKYTWNYTGYKLKELLGLVATDLSRIQVFRLLWKAVLGHLKLLRDNNPFWNFDYLMQLEKKYGIKAGYFFLPQGQKHVDSYYNFKESRLKELFEELLRAGHEIALHGTVKSASNLKDMIKGKDNLNEAANTSVTGIRQHRLSFQHPHTFCLMEEAGFNWDSSLGFAAHEGFRNSYCLPFKPYDFENDRMINIWELPLNVMDATLFKYRNLSYEGAYESIDVILKEIQHFGGLFTLLWHNSFFDEIEFPGIRGFYEGLLERAAKMGYDSQVASIPNKPINFFN